MNRSSHRLLALGALLVAAPSFAGAQRMPDINAPKQAAQKAVDAENARLSAQTGQEIPARRGAATTGAAAAPAPAPRSGPGAAPAPQPATAAGSGFSVSREVFGYEGAGRRDPFFSLILTEDLRPLLTDLKLVGILFEASGRRSVAIMRDLVTNAQYRVTAGMTLGRMRVAQIRPRVVIFSVDEFGLSRQDSLVMSDTLKVIR